MSEYSLLNQEFHAFSKSPIKGDLRLFNAVNKSGHTVTTSEIWADDIPWFTEVSNKSNAIERAKDAKYNDIIILASIIYKRKGDKTNGASTGTTFEDLWEVYEELNTARSYALQISSGLVSTIDKKLVLIKNSNDDVVVEYYVGYPIDLLTFENNSNQSSLSAARMFINNEVVEQFVSSTDKIYKGFPSTGYNVLVYTTTGSGNYNKIVEGESDDDFINNAYAGIIQFNKDRDKTHLFAASIYKYVGKFGDALTARFEKSIPAIESYTTKTIKESYTYQSDTSGSIDAANGCYGICYIPKTNVKVTSILINQINNGGGTSATNINNCYIKVFAKDESGAWKLVANSPNHWSPISGPYSITTKNNNTQNYWSNKWSVQGAGINQGSDFIAKEGVEYHITLNLNNNDIDSYETDYSIRMCMYSNSSNEYVLGTNVNHTFINFTPNFIIEGELVEMTVTSETVYPTHLYGEFLNNKHDISYKYDKTNNVVSFNDGIVTFSDGTERYFDIQKAVIAKYLFRGDSSSTITEFNTRKEYDTWLNNRAHCNDFYYEYDCYVTQKDSQGSDLYVYDDDIDSSTGRPTISTLQNVINGKNLFLRSQLTKFNDDLSCLMNGFQMFASSDKLEKFRSALPSLTNGIKMFVRCSALTKFETKLPNLVLAECMFRYATSLEEINTCLPNLTHAQGMFMYCSNLSKIRFSKNSFGCLYNGCDMFKGCSKLGSFYYELPYLETANDMFLDCQLDVKSVRIIAESLYDFGTKDSNNRAEDGRKHVITIGIRQGDRDKVQTYVELMDSKGWVVEIIEYSGSDPLPPSEDDNPPDDGSTEDPNPDTEPDPAPEPDPDPVPEQGIYDISETNPNQENPYVADIPAWQNEIYKEYDLKITNITFDENRNVGIMIGTVGENN